MPESAVAVSEIARNYGIVAAGAVGVGLAWWRAVAADRQSLAQRDQAIQSRREHETELFAKAISDLDSSHLHMRMAAILMLKNTVEVFPELGDAAIKILTAYLNGVEYSDEDPPADVLEIIDLIVPTFPEGAQGVEQ